jgi:hypothetical protein
MMHPLSSWKQNCRKNSEVAYTEKSLSIHAVFRDVYAGSEFFHLGSRIQGQKDSGPRILDPDSQDCIHGDSKQSYRRHGSPKADSYKSRSY